MLTVQFWETFVLASLGLGSVVFILFVVLPPLLRRAKYAVEADFQEFKSKVADAEARNLKEVTSHYEKLSLSAQDLRTVLRSGAISAVAFLLAGAGGLGVLTIQPILVGGIEVVPLTSTWESIIGILFISGFFVFLFFFVSFLRIVQLALKYDEAREAVEERRFEFR